MTGGSVGLIHFTYGAQASVETRDERTIEGVVVQTSVMGVSLVLDKGTPEEQLIFLPWTNVTMMTLMPQ